MREEGEVVRCCYVLERRIYRGRASERRIRRRNRLQSGNAMPRSTVLASLRRRWSIRIPCRNRRKRHSYFLYFFHLEIINRIFPKNKRTEHYAGAGLRDGGIDQRERERDSVHV